MSEGTFFDDTTVTLMIAIAMIRTVRENKPIKTIFFLSDIRRFHSRLIGMVITIKMY